MDPWRGHRPRTSPWPSRTSCEHDRLQRPPAPLARRWRGAAGPPAARPVPPRPRHRAAAAASPAPPLPPRSIWDDGTVNPEPALDQFDLVSRGGAVRWLLGGLAVFGVAGAAIYVSHPETRTPWVSAAGPSRQPPRARRQGFAARRGGRCTPRRPVRCPCHGRGWGCARRLTTAHAHARHAGP